MKLTCFSCSQQVELKTPIGRSDVCKCSADLRSCKNCRFYDTGYNNECRETSAEKIQEKERANFCGYFSPNGEKDSYNGSKINHSGPLGNEIADFLKKKAPKNPFG